MQDRNLFFTDNADGFIAQFNSGSFSSVFILTDENTALHCLPVFKKKYPQLAKAKIIKVKGGEEHKTITTVEKIWKQMSPHSDRFSVLINLGGGIITDMGGFAAATLKRGISFINVPTSLLGMADAAVGGKTGVNFEGIKNQIGSFSDAYATLMDFDFLATLPERDMKSGFAEMVKMGMIASSELFCQLSEIQDIRREIDGVMIKGAIYSKLEIVADDPFESGRRKLLNFGHTIGHALESVSLIKDDVSLSHGDAVAHGMICESLLALRRGILNEEDFIKIKDLIFHFFGKYPMDNTKIEELIEVMRFDKKNKEGRINFTLPVEIGDGEIDQYADTDEIREILKSYVLL